MSNNNLADAGLILLSAGLKSSKLETLRLVCQIKHACFY